MNRTFIKKLLAAALALAVLFGGAAARGFARATPGGIFIGASAVAAPAAPSGFKAAFASFTSVRLTWNASANATGYVIYRYNPAKNAFTRLAAVKGLSYTDTGLTKGNTYFYKIAAYTASGGGNVYGKVSPPVYCTLKLAAPGNFKAAPSQYNSARLSWDPVSGAKGYAVYRSMTKTGGFARVGTTASGDFVDIPLATGQVYYYKVFAYAPYNGKNEYSPASATAGVKVVPQVPQSLKAVSLGYNRVKLTWDSVKGADGYIAYYATAKDGPYTLVQNYIKDTEATFSPLDTGVTYYFRIRSYAVTTLYGSAVSAACPPVSVKPVPAAPVAVTAVSAGAGSVTVTWDAVEGATGYTVYRAGFLGILYNDIASTSETTYTDTGLTTGSIYNYKVKAYFTTEQNENIYGPSSAAAQARPVPSAPVPATVPVTADAIEISWPAVDGASGYEIYVSDSEGGAFTLLNNSADATFIHAPVATGVPYYYKVRAYAPFGRTVVYGDYSGVVSAVTNG